MHPYIGQHPFSNGDVHFTSMICAQPESTGTYGAGDIRTALKLARRSARVSLTAEAVQLVADLQELVEEHSAQAATAAEQPVAGSQPADSDMQGKLPSFCFPPSQPLVADAAQQLQPPQTRRKSSQSPKMPSFAEEFRATLRPESISTTSDDVQLESGSTSTGWEPPQFSPSDWLPSTTLPMASQSCDADMLYSRRASHDTVFGPKPPASTAGS